MIAHSLSTVENYDSIYTLERIEFKIKIKFN